jgi:hypothetical protein
MSGTPLLIITGPPRSGTTRLAAFCQMMGQPLEGRWFPGQEGGLEDDRVKPINKALMTGGLTEEIAARITAFPAPILKEPRFVTLSEHSFIESWHRVRPELRLLILLRDFEQIGHSLHKSRGVKPIGDTPQVAAEWIAGKYRRFMDGVEALNIPHLILHHPEFVEKFTTVRDVLMKFGGLSLIPNKQTIQAYGLEPGTPEEVWNQWFDREKVRQHASEANKSPPEATDAAAEPSK